ncbi:MAG: hypothetical protein IPJ65_00325 [Archangiaceae bacterium]|nr:hypothetical protein [Archangiaceae bacterium]
MSASLPEAVARARAELQALEAREAEQLEKSGLRDTVHRLTDENQALQLEREAVREGTDRLRAELKAAQEQRATLELQLKGARARVQRLSLALRPRR